MRLSSLVQTTGLGNLTAEELALLEPEHEADRSQHWQWPASPYLGATHDQEGGPAVPAAPYIGSSTEASDLPYFVPAVTAEEVQEGSLGVQEAADLALTEVDTPAAAEDTASHYETSEPTSQPEPQAFVEEVAPAPAPVELPVHNSILNVALAALQAMPTDEAGLNFRVIQYARLATRLAASQDFSVIYASDWQSWLAGMEIRQLTGKPLVLHVYSLAQERNTPADRGWVMEMERMALRRADLILTSSSDLALRVIELYEVPPQRVRRLSRAANQDPDLLAETILSALGEVS
jgi:hypothetical protein